MAAGCLTADTVRNSRAGMGVQDSNQSTSSGSPSRLCPIRVTREAGRERRCAGQSPGFIDAGEMPFR